MSKASLTKTKETKTTRRVVYGGASAAYASSNKSNPSKSTENQKVCSKCKRPL